MPAAVQAYADWVTPFVLRDPGQWRGWRYTKPRISQRRAQSAGRSLHKRLRHAGRRCSYGEAAQNARPRLSGVSMSRASKAKANGQPASATALSVSCENAEREPKG